MRHSNALAISLLAEIEGHIVGHIAFSLTAIADGSEDWHLFGPVPVTPELQGRGIGRTLVRVGLDALAALGARACMLAGDPHLYTRFRFCNQPECTYPGIPQEVFLLLAFAGQIPKGKSSPPRRSMSERNP